VNVQLPDGASVQRTKAVTDRIDRIARAMPGVDSTVAISGQSMLLDANASNWASMYVMLKPFGQREQPELRGPRLAARLRAQCRKDVQEAVVNVFGPPPVNGLGTVAGFKFVIEDRGNLGQDRLQHIADLLVAEGNRTP